MMIVPALLFGASFGFAAEKQAPAPAARVAKCCATAAQNEKACTHGCCVEAAKAGKNCEKCGGAGMREAKKS